MSTIQEIIAVLPNLSTDELHHIEKAIHNLYLDRHEHILYDDDYGTPWTEQDQISTAAEVFQCLDDLDEEEDVK